MVPYLYLVRAIELADRILLYGKNTRIKGPFKLTLNLLDAEGCIGTWGSGFSGFSGLKGLHLGIWGS